MKISNGIDLVNVERKEFNNQKMVNKILHPNELIIFNSHNDYNQKRFLAKTWCIKEAIYKAYNHQYTMDKIEILYKDKKAYAIIDGYFFDISISYESNLVIAIASTVLD